MALIVNEFQDNLNNNNCTGAAALLSNGDIFISSPFGYNKLFSRNNFRDNCVTLSQTRLTVDYGVGDMAAEEVYGFLIYQFDGVSVSSVSGGGYTASAVKGINVIGFSNYYDIEFFVSFFEAGQQNNFTNVRQFVYSTFDLLKRGDCNRWGASFTVDAVFESDYDVMLNGRMNITDGCTQFFSGYSRFTIEVEEVYVSGPGAMAYIHFMGVTKATGEPVITNTFAYLEITSTSRLQYLFFVNDVYTGTNRTLVG